MHRPAAALAVLIATAFAAAAQIPDLPPRKPGLWEMRMVTEKPVGGPTIDAKLCIDAVTDRELMDFGLRMSKDTCKRYDTKRQGKAWVIDAECSFGPISSATKTTITGDFQTTVNVRIEGTTEGIPGVGKGPQQTLMTQTGRWTAAICSGGMMPGDIALASGVKFNVKDLKGLKKLLPKIQIR
jgi:hypothetical protein